MKKRVYGAMGYLRLVIVLVVVLSFFVPFMTTPTLAKAPPDKKVETEILGPDDERLDQFSVKHFDGLVETGKQLRQRYTVTTGMLPQTLDDLKTKVTVEWREGKDEDGITYFKSGNNVYYAQVTGTRVTQEYKGALAASDPALYLDGSRMEVVEGPYVAVDPFAPKNGRNTIVWEYKLDRDFLDEFFGNDDVIIKRYLRQIPGILQEIYEIPEDPQGTFRVAQQYEKEEAFRWESNIWATSANGRALVIVGDLHEKYVDAREFARPDIEYPVLVDPSTGYIGATNYDGNLYNSGSVYATVHDASSGTISYSTTGKIGQYFETGYYEVMRFPLMFNTGLYLPDDCEVVSGFVQVYGHSDLSTADFYLTLQTGGGTYPHTTLVATDYGEAHYSGTGGSKSTSTFTTSGYNTITLSSAGLGWVKTADYTKFILRSSEDISESAPTGAEYVWIYEASAGASYQPRISLTYEVAATRPDVTTYDVNDEDISTTSTWVSGHIDDDGGAECDVWFDYGTTTSYGYSTVPDDGYETGDLFEDDISGLLPGTLYHVTAKAQNNLYTSYDDDATFLTEPSKPTGFSATPGDTEVALVWTKGTGADNTVIRRSTSGFPTSPTSGTAIYDDTGTSHTDETVTNGITYYYSAFSKTVEGGYTQYSTTYATASGTPEALGPPVVETFYPSPVGTETATAQGSLTSLQGYADADVWFQYYWGAGTWTDHETTPETLTAVGLFDASLADLPADTTIYIRAAGDSDGGTAYGDSVPFVTGEAYAPVINTVSYGGVTDHGATMYGEVEDDGSASSGVSVRFNYGETEELGTYTGELGPIYDDDPDPTFHVTLIDLEPATTIYFRAEGYNSIGTGYGVTLNFTTGSPDAPEVTCDTPTGIGATSALFHGLLNDDGGTSCSVQFVWGTNVTLTSGEEEESGWQTDKISGSAFQHFATNMTIDTLYYVMAQAQNSGGTTNSTIISFETIFTAPQNFATVPLTANSISLTWEPQSDKTLIMGKRGAYPADRLDGDQVYFGGSSSAVWENLDEGATYFFRAWSWRDGDNFSETYAQDVCTTTSGARLTSPDTPYDTMNKDMPDAPSNWWQTPSSGIIENWPLVPSIDAMVVQTGIPLWPIVSMVIGLIAGGISAMLIPTPVAVLGGTTTALTVLAAAGLVSGWWVGGFVILAVALYIIITH